MAATIRVTESVVGIIGNNQLRIKPDDHNGFQNGPKHEQDGRRRRNRAIEVEVER